MISRSRRARGGRRAAGGFTLIEVLAVLTILGFGLALVAIRGPGRPVAVEMRAVAEQVADTLRLARTRAIATNRAVEVLFDGEGRRVVPAWGAAQTIPAGLDMMVLGVSGPVEGARLVVRFSPDGGATGGALELAAGTRRVRVGVSWLSGHVVVTDGP